MKPLRQFKPSSKYPVEIMITTLRETASVDKCVDTPDLVRDYLVSSVTTAPDFRRDQECFFVVYFNTRRRIIGHSLVAMGVLDSVQVHAREVFRGAIVSGAHSIVIAHNHPSGDPTPSESDIRVTRELIRAGQLLKLELVDHIILGERTDSRPRDYVSMRELGYFHI